MNIQRLNSILIAVAMAISFNTALADAQCDNEDIFDYGVFGIFPEGGFTGSATFCAVKNGLKAQMNVEGLVPGNAYTIWWAYFDNQEANGSTCEGGFPFTGACGFADFAGADPGVVFGRLGSVVASENGKAHFGNELGGMQASSGAEVWLLMFGHGAADMEDRRKLARQLLTPEDPTSGFPHLGVDPHGYPAAMTVHVVD